MTAPVGQPKATAGLLFEQSFTTAGPQWIEVAANVLSPPADADVAASITFGRTGQASQVSVGHTAGGTTTAAGALRRRHICPHGANQHRRQSVRKSRRRRFCAVHRRHRGLQRQQQRQRDRPERHQNQLRPGRHHIRGRRRRRRRPHRRRRLSPLPTPIRRHPPPDRDPSHPRANEHGTPATRPSRRQLSTTIRDLS